MKLEVRNTRGSVLTSVDARDDVFAAPMNSALLHQVIVGQLANKRQGTAKVKSRSEVSGGGAKPRPQKHTGRARQGSIRAPQWRGGGVAFGPTPRSYKQRTPKRMKRDAIKIVLSDKARSRNLIVLDDFALDAAKTKNIANILQALKVESSALLVSDDNAGTDIARAARNLPKVRAAPVSLLNALDLLNANKVVMTLDAVRKAESIWGGKFARRPQPAVALADADDAPASEDEAGE